MPGIRSRTQYDRRCIPSLVALLLVIGLCGCSSSKSVFPASGSLSLAVLDSGVNQQSAPVPANQIVRWTFQSVSADIEGFGSYEFLGVSPCAYTYNVLAAPSLLAACGGSRLVLGASSPRTATVHLAISSMEARRAFRPSLTAAGDYDGDGIGNAKDNCPLVPNPDQELSANGNSGVACTVADVTTGTAVDPDRDGDGEADAIDNCLWVPNPGQADADLDGIGDTCEQVARIVIGPGTLNVDLAPVTVTVPQDSAVTLVVDFDDRKTLVECDSAFTRCFLNIEAIRVQAR